MRKTIYSALALVLFVLLLSFGDKPEDKKPVTKEWELKTFEDEYDVKIWLNNTQPSEVHIVSSIGPGYYIWKVFYVK